MQPRHYLLFALILVCFCQWSKPGRSSETLASSIKQTIQDRCVSCHNADDKNGGVDLVELIEGFDPESDLDVWVKVEAAVVNRKMPPADEKPLAREHISQFENWFDRQFVRPNGVQHAGPNRPRRLTREELQNTLEDILHVDLRVTVTNSRLHVIPDTIIEKFFPAGVVGESGFSNDAVTLGKESIDIQTYARCFSLVLSLLDADEAAREKLFGQATLDKNLAEDDAREFIRRFGRSAYRREMSDSELDAFFAVYKRMAEKKPPYESIKSSFLAILLSPPFLYRFEDPLLRQNVVPGDELAARLSYFLWSAPPDATLIKLAADRKLREPEVIKQQVRRMLADPRRVALAENLGGEWFDYKKLRQQSSVNKRSDKMAGFYRTQYEEALLFFDSIIRYDQLIKSSPIT